MPDSAFKRGPLIYKPDDGAQGDGIEIIMSARDLATKLMNKPHPAVVQRCMSGAVCPALYVRRGIVRRRDQPVSF